MRRDIQTMKRLLTIMIVIMVAFCLCPFSAYAEELHPEAAEELHPEAAEELHPEAAEEAQIRAEGAGSAEEPPDLEDAEAVGAETEQTEESAAAGAEAEQAEEAEVVVAETVPEFAEEIQNAPSEAYIEIAPEDTEAYEESELYAVETYEDGTAEAISVYSRKRLIVMDEEEITDTYGASKVVCMDDFQVLLYDDEQMTRDAYLALQETYGDAVIIDQPVRTQEAADAGVESAAGADAAAVSAQAATVGWGTRHMNLDLQTKAIESSGIGEPVCIAVLDSGITPEHEIFARTNTKISKDSCCVINGYSRSYYRDDLAGGHGTATAGIIAESTPENVELLVIKVLDAKGDGSFLDVYNGLRIALEKGADVVNMSLGGSLYEETGYGLGVTSESRLQVAFLEDALGRLVSSGATIVCSAGNDNCDIDEWQVYPARSDKTIAVGAIDKYNCRSGFSNTGRAIDYVAPGVGLKAASNLKKTSGGSNPYASYATVSGTSFSAPYVAAAAALIKETSPGMSQTQVMKKLDAISKDLGTAGWDSLYGYGVPIFDGTDRSARTVRPAAASTSITGATVTGITNRNYTGKALGQSPTVRLKVAEHIVTLEKGTDYTLSYKNNTNIGTATVTITGKGIYSGTITRSFRIRAHGLCKGAKGWGVYKSGSLNTKANGLYQDAQTKKWYLIKKGLHNKQFVGVAKSAKNGRWYFARKGTYDKRFTGLAKSMANGNYYYVRKGALDWNFTGVAKSITNGKWYFARKGKLDWSYTGGAKSIANGRWYAVKKGALNWNYTGRLKGTDGKRRRYIKGKAK